MGADDGLPSERPAHRVTVAPYCIDALEVTTDDYRACSDRGDCKRAGATNEWSGITGTERHAFDSLCNGRDPLGHARHPVNCVDWDMAALYCRSHGERLPTEAEWEFAARGTDGRRYPWGDEVPGPHLLNACGRECVDWGRRNHVDEAASLNGTDGWATTAPVGSFPDGQSRFGVQDLVGNVAEWVGDVYAPYGAEPDAANRDRVIRGAAWDDASPEQLRPTFRRRESPDVKSYGVGFRCAGPQERYARDVLTR